MDTTQGLEGDSPQVIREQIEQTRASLGHKLETLETEVRSSVQDASDSVREGIDKVKRTLDLRYQIREHPWVATSAALGVGYLLGSADLRRVRSTADTGQEALKSGRRAAAGWLERRLGAERERVRALSYGLGLAFIKELVRRSLPARISPVAERFLGTPSKTHSEMTRWPDQDI
jgi:ElaB/YqjD/DUF883 family membrane-anchored ribosome-binding protein